MNQRWTPGSGAVVTRFPITQNGNAENDQSSISAEESSEENNQFNASEDVRSIMFAFIIVFIFFSGVFLLKHFEKLNFDNIALLILLVFSAGLFWDSHRKSDVSEVIDFKEPRIGED